MGTYQKIYDEVNSGLKESDPCWASVVSAFESQNKEYGYFSTDEEKAAAQKAFIRYFHFFDKVKDGEDRGVGKPELYRRAYHATVVFGGGDFTKACDALDQLVKEHDSHAKKPIHDLFSTLTIQKKATALNLPFWRKWINHPPSKKALKLFASASDIANKFGTLHDKRYALALTKTPPNPQKVLSGTVHLMPHQADPNKLSYVYRDEKMVLVSGEIDKQSLNDDVSAIFSNAAWTRGVSPTVMLPSTQDHLFGGCFETSFTR